ncbi:hypothetical protein TMatcc_000477 [Talaromyces marneffei ATCC 18224]|uniref:uncharacterized protein n=1 Tax=Talaromyces marneffei TaxID=37727 RepID=UPI0012A8E3BF|nr:uncharacterized protein EYB26_003059 [Talaromyces marneffei]KAE8549475.1 hypothetical protein EYB25_007997 [Talaromyces marneffei]QGA15401.1 hypothetical protein EYB26_003059 [Talaromyces marneffei]
MPSEIKQVVQPSSSSLGKLKKTRASRPKVRTGCGTCKIRHKKCDETQPSCYMCTSTGRTCDGYRQTPDRRTRAFRKIKKGSPSYPRPPIYDSGTEPIVEGQQADEVGEETNDEEECIGIVIPQDNDPTPPVKTQTVTRRVASSPPPKGRPSVFAKSPRSKLTSSAALLADPYKASLSDSERWHFEFFIRNTSSQCSVFYGHDFWQRIVPQYTEVEPGLRHAVIAVGALHRNFEQSQLNSQDPDYSFAIQQCNRAIYNLQHRLVGDKSRHMEVALITCILFVSFAFLQGDAGAASRLMHGGVKLLLEWEKISSSLDDSTIKLALMRVFSRIQFHAMTCGDPDFFVEDKFSPPKGTMNVMPPNQDLSQPIDSIEAASSLLFDIGWVVMQRKPWLSYPHRNDDYDVVATLNKLQYWEAQCHISLMSRREELSVKDRGSWIMLQMWSETIYILAATDWCADGRESRFDCLLSRFQKTIEYAKELLTTESMRSFLPTFHMGPGIIPPLFLCINKCRDWNLRQEAMSLLQSWPCQEGFWNTTGSAKCLEKLIELEMEGLLPGEVVPESQRIIATHVDYLPQTNTYRFWYRQSQAVGTSRWKSTVLSV